MLMNRGVEQIYGSQGNGKIRKKKTGEYEWAKFI